MSNELDIMRKAAERDREYIQSRLDGMGEDETARHTTMIRARGAEWLRAGGAAADFPLADALKKPAKGKGK